MLKKSLIEVAVEILKDKRDPLNIYTLYDMISLEVEMSEEEKANMLAQFYTDLTTSAKFVYMGNDTFDLKSNQKVELWDKDGSFYKEYTEVPDEDVADEDDDEDDYEFDPLYDDPDELPSKKKAVSDDDEDDDEELEDDEDLYNEYMDEYEDLYDE
jgi:DNA-directed RNA polymerase subunit delta